MNFTAGSEFGAVNLWVHQLPVIMLFMITLMINSHHILMGAAHAPYMKTAPMKKVLPSLFLYV
ncbi:AzlC family ABC transporter permease [Neisseria iguanae]|uniref:AzlC family ABC transporter permease n=1 Tax=Neisseria iguanae TaxID=90242 RepID=UPI00318322E2